MDFRDVEKNSNFFTKKFLRCWEVKNFQLGGNFLNPSPGHSGARADATVLVACHHSFGVVWGGPYALARRTAAGLCGAGHHVLVLPRAEDSVQEGPFVGFPRRPRGRAFAI